MSVAKVLRVYLEPDMLELAKGGGFNIGNQIEKALSPKGFRTEYRLNSEEERLKSATRNGYSLFHMEDPFHDRALNLRRAYFYPYWRIESSAKRWEFEVAQKKFYAPVMDTQITRDWAARWRKWMFKTTLADIKHDGPVYVALQGLLSEHRSFQFCSPIDMVHHTLEHFKDASVVVGLHPGETYSSAELDVLDALQTRHKNLSVVTGRMNKLLANCRCVVTQNSAAALFGFFHHKPAVLFGQIDFHHIAQNVQKLGVEPAFTALSDEAPAYDKYLFWFSQMNAIKADEDDAADQISRVLSSRGWQLD